MAHSLDAASSAARTEAVARPAAQAYLILLVGFAALPVVAGSDKFFHALVNWDMYLAPRVELLPVTGHTFMLAVGVIGIAAELLVALRPRIGADVVAAWLGGSSSTCPWSPASTTSRCATSACRSGRWRWPG